jgi:hypothetical protein
MLSRLALVVMKHATFLSVFLYDNREKNAGLVERQSIFYERKPQCEN